MTVSAPTQPEWSVDRQPVLLRWQPERGDYAEAFALRARQRHTTRKLAVAIGLFAVALVVGWVAQLGTLVGASVGAIVAIVLLMLLQPLMVRRFWSGSTALRQPVEAHLSPAGIDSRTVLSAGQWPWTSVHSVLEGERCYVVQMHGYKGKAFLPLAKRGAPDPPAQAALRAWLAPYLNVTRA
ncbi:MAG: hypothetical protein V7637_5853 [Mycobacteriales bacterium]